MTAVHSSGNSASELTVRAWLQKDPQETSGQHRLRQSLPPPRSPPQNSGRTKHRGETPQKSLLLSQHGPAEGQGNRLPTVGPEETNAGVICQTLAKP